CHRCPPHLPLHSFPTRRSSDLAYPLNALFPAPSDHLGCAGRGSRTCIQSLFLKIAICCEGSVSTVGAGTSPTARISFSSCSKDRSEEHTSELQSRSDLVCRLLL